MNKSITEIVFFIRKPKDDVELPEYFETPYYNDKPVYQCWPRLPHHPEDPVYHWFYRGDLFELVKAKPVPNLFSDVVILDHVNTRHYSAKVPQAAVYSKEFDCYLQFDFRAEGLTELLCNYSVTQGSPSCDMSFMYKGSNYYFVPTAGSFQKYKKDFEQANKPKTKQTTEVEVGIPFIGSWGNPYRYLGAFKCTEDGSYNPNGDTSDRTNYKDKTVHLYQECENWEFQSDEEEKKRPRIYVTKSKMAVKSHDIPEDTKILPPLEATKFDTDRFTKGAYGTGFVRLYVDYEDMTVRIVEELPPGRRNRGNCGFPFFS